MSKKFYNDSHKTHTKWVEYQFEQDAAAQMAQPVGAEAQAAEQAAQMQAQEAEQKALALRQGVGGAIGELLSIMPQLDPAAAQSAARQMSTVLIDVGRGMDPNKAAAKASGVLQNAASKLR